MLEKKEILFVNNKYAASLSEITSDIVDYLTKTNKYNIIVGGEPQKYDIIVSHLSFQVTKLRLFKRFKKRVLIFPVDGTSINNEVIDMTNMFTDIITLTNIGKKILVENGVDENKIIIIPNYYKYDDIFGYSSYKKKLQNKINNIFKTPKEKRIYYYESTMHPRKNYEQLIKAFVETLSYKYITNNPHLLIWKTTIGPSKKEYDRFETFKKEIHNIQKKYKSPANVLRISNFMSKDKLRALWDMTDVYIHPAKIEGFGLPLLRMSMMGKEIVAPWYMNSGYTEYLSKYPRILRIPVGDEEESCGINYPLIYSNDSKWAVIDDDLLRYAIIASSYKKENLKSTKEYIAFCDEKYNYSVVMKKYEVFFDSLNFEKNFCYD